MADVLRTILVAAAMLLGMAAGIIGAFFATFYTCVLVDRVRGASGGNGVVTVGWLFCFVTIPIGACVGIAIVWFIV